LQDITSSNETKKLKVTLHIAPDPLDRSTVDTSIIEVPVGAVLSSIAPLSGEDTAWACVRNMELIDSISWSKTELRDGDTVSFAIIPGNNNSFRMLSMMVLVAASAWLGPAAAGAVMGKTVAAGSFAANMATFAITTAGALVINALLPPSIPDDPDSSGTSHGWDQLGNFTEQGRVIPELYGTVRSGERLYQDG